MVIYKYDFIGIWLFYIQLTIFSVFIFYFIKVFFNIYKDKQTYKKAQNEKII